MPTGQGSGGQLPRPGEDKRAETLAGEVIREGTSYLGEEVSPMRLAEARLTLGVVAAREGDLEQAINYGELALNGERKSLPSLLMISKELAVLVNKKFAKAPETRAYVDHLTTLSRELTSGGV